MGRHYEKRGRIYSMTRWLCVVCGGIYIYPCVTPREPTCAHSQCPGDTKLRPISEEEYEELKKATG